MMNRTIRSRAFGALLPLALLTLALCSPAQADASLRCMDVPDMEGDAQYTCFGTAVNEPRFKGWAHVNSNICMMSTDRACDPTINAYRWTGTEWSRRNISSLGEMYHWPWKNGWSWVWTKQTGWLATRRMNVLIYFTCTNNTGGRFVPSQCSTSSDLLDAASLLAS